MRRCTRCDRKAPDKLFAIKFKTVPRGLCKKCKSTYNKSWYHRNKSKHVANVTRNNSRYRRRLLAITDRFKNKPCADCGKKFPPIAMDFDHLDPNNKVASISDMVARVVSVEELLDEIAKCEVVCAVHHRIRTWKRYKKNIFL